jgi:hypothetical protein
MLRCIKADDWDVYYEREQIAEQISRKGETFITELGEGKWGLSNGNRTQNSRAACNPKGIEPRTPCAIGTGAPPGRRLTARPFGDIYSVQLAGRSGAHPGRPQGGAKYIVYWN